MKGNTNKFGYTVRLTCALAMGLGLAAVRVCAEDNTSIYYTNGLVNNVISTIVGNTGTNNYLEVSNATTLVNTNDFVIGFNAGANSNLAVVAGIGSILTNTGQLVVNRRGTGNVLRVESGGQVYGTSVVIGNDNQGMGGLARVTGTNSLLQQTANANNFIVGGNASASSGNTLLADSGGTVLSPTYMIVGQFGMGNSLIVSNGGFVSTKGLIVSYQAGTSSNQVIVTGIGSVLSNSVNGNLMGQAGGGNTFRVENGGVYADASNFYVGNSAGSSNNLLLVNGGTVRAGADFHFGQISANNTMIITNGGLVLSGAGAIGGAAGATGNKVIVTGVGSVWSNTSSVFLGYVGGSEQTTVSAGGKLYSNGGSVGFTAASSTNNTVTITDPGSIWYSINDVAIGAASVNNHLVVTNGGEVVFGHMRVGSGATASGDVLITGPGSILRANFVNVGSNTTYASENGVGAVTVRDGGTLEVSIQMLTGRDGKGTITNQGGIFQFTTISPTITTNSPNSIVVNGGTISYRNVTAAGINNGEIAKMTFVGNNTFQLNKSTNTTVPSYTFDSVANTGTATNYQKLALADGGRWQSTSLAIGSGGALIGNGTVASANVTNLGTIAPGFSAGSLTFTSNLVLGTSSRLEMEIGGIALSNYDQLIVAGNVTVTGTLAITTINLFAPTPGQTFTLIDNQGANPISGLFNGLTNNAFIDASANGFDAFFRIQYDGGTGNDLVLIATVPEPSTLVFLSFAALLVLRRRIHG